MELKNLLKNKVFAKNVKSKIANERQEVIGMFLERLNLDRKLPYKPLTPARVGIMLRYVETKDLRAFYAECAYANNFSKYFWWRMKI